MYLQIGKEACDDKVFQMNIYYSFDHSFDQTRRSSLGSFIFLRYDFYLVLQIIYLSLL